MMSKPSEKSDVPETDRLDGWVFYDGACPLCAELARAFEGTLKRRRFDLMSFETPWVRARLGLRPDEPLTEMKVLTKDGALRGDGFDLSWSGGATGIAPLRQEMPNIDCP